MNKEATPTKDSFQFKSFSIVQDNAAMKVGTDGVLLGAWVDTKEVKSVLDIGTGTGVIALMLAQRCPSTKVDAVEVSDDACTLAATNFQASPWSDRLSLHATAIQDFESQTDFDLIVCNPPFFTGGTLSSSEERNKVRHTIKLPNGELIRAVRRLLSTEGAFSVVLPLIEGLRFKEMAESSGFYCHKMTEVKGHINKDVERLLLTFRKTPGICKVDELSINQSDKRHDYTPKYVELVKDFYTIL